MAGAAVGPPPASAVVALAAPGDGDVDGADSVGALAVAGAAVAVGACVGARVAVGETGAFVGMPGVGSWAELEAQPVSAAPSDRQRIARGSGFRTPRIRKRGAARIGHAPRWVSKR